MSQPHPRHVLFGDARRQLELFAPLLTGYGEVPQRSEAWFALRKRTLSGSRLSSLIYARSAFELDKLWRQTFDGTPGSPMDARGLQNCRWGQDHEQDAVNFLLERGPPDAHVFDVSFQRHQKQHWLGASPDGLYWSPTTCGDRLAVLECKCPAKRDPETGLTVPYPAPPAYYIPQCYLEMRSMVRPVDVCIFVCWSQTESRAWKLEFEPDTWLTLYEWMADFAARDVSWKCWQKRTKELQSTLAGCAARATRILV